MHTKSFVRDWGLAKNSECYKDFCENTSTEPPAPPPSMSSPVLDLILLYSGEGRARGWVVYIMTIGFHSEAFLDKMILLIYQPMSYKNSYL